MVVDLGQGGPDLCHRRRKLANTALAEVLTSLADGTGIVFPFLL